MPIGKRWFQPGKAVGQGTRMSPPTCPHSRVSVSSMFMYLNLRSGATLGYLMVSQYKSVSYVFVLRGQGWPRTVGHDH